MGNLMKQGAAWLEQQRHKHCTSSIKYVRGLDSVTVNASIGRTVFKVDDGFGRIERTQSRDYLILATELILNALPVLPERGDHIEENTGVVTYIYEVMAPGKEPEWRWSDAYRNTLRIHTKLVGEEYTP